MSYVNEGVWDRIIRVAIGAALLYLGWSGTIDGSWGTFLKYFGFFPLATGLSGFCVLYYLFGFRTNGPIRERAKTGPKDDFAEEPADHTANRAAAERIEV